MKYSLIRMKYSLIRMKYSQFRNAFINLTSCFVTFLIISYQLYRKQYTVHVQTVTRPVELHTHIC